MGLPARRRALIGPRVRRWRWSYGVVLVVLVAGCVEVVDVVRPRRGAGGGLVLVAPVVPVDSVVDVCPGTVLAGCAGPAGAVVVAVVGMVAVVETTGGGTTAPAGGVVSMTAVGVVPAVAPSSAVSSTNANASSAPASRTIAPIATVGSCQFGVGARRVRAGAPHSRHQSWSGPTVAEQRGQRSEPGAGS